MERDAFLDRVRAAAAPQRVGRAHPLPPDPGPQQAWPGAGTDVVSDFEAAARRHGASVSAAAGPEALGVLVGEVVESWGVRSAVVSCDPEVAAAAALLEDRGVKVVPWDGPGAASRADLGVTGAAYGIAATGSVVVDAGRAGGRTASLLPPGHLAVLRIDLIVATPSDLWREMAVRFPDGPPSQFVVVTGPSKTGDIEQVPTTGVHGPGRLHVALVSPG